MQQKHLSNFKKIVGLSIAIMQNTTPKVSSDFVEKYNNLMTTPVTSLEKLAAIHPKTVGEINDWLEAGIILAQQELDAILAIPDNDRTFENTVQALDQSHSKLSRLGSIFGMLHYVHPNKEIRDALEQAKTTLKNSSIDLYMNSKLYQAFAYYNEHQRFKEKLLDEDILLLEDALKDFKISGLHLPEDELAKVKQASKDLAKLRQDFQTNISKDNPTLSCSKSELAGLNDKFLARLQRDGDLYVVPCDPPTFRELMEQCSITSTRKKMFLMQKGCAYPVNDTLLTQILKKQQDLAKLLGYKDYATLNLEGTSAEHVTTVHNFLTNLQKASRKKAEKEIALLKTDLPEGVAYRTDGTLNPWDYLYTVSEYRKKHFKIDESLIAEYFPAQKVLDAMLKIYQDFLGLKFKEVKPVWSWHEDVKLIEIYRQNELLGYLFLDLYPRPNKFKHFCHYGQVDSYQVDGKNIPSAAVIIANFPQPCGDTPALLTHNAVTTFFHEFGHAMHNVLGRTKHSGHSGTSVKADFVETPSQMFEQWMSEHEILAEISSHYLTGKPLPTEIIAQKIKLKKSDAGYAFLRQCLLGLFALHLMTNEEFSYNPSALWQKYQEDFFEGLVGYEDIDHSYATFGHLAAGHYAAKYYSYAWTEIIAIDLFDQIKNHQFSQEYRDKVIKLLSAGGSIHPNTLLHDFLGREPNQEAFLTAFGLK